MIGCALRLALPQAARRPAALGARKVPCCSALPLGVSAGSKTRKTGNGSRSVRVCRGQGRHFGNPRASARDVAASKLDEQQEAADGLTAEEREANDSFPEASCSGSGAAALASRLPSKSVEQAAAKVGCNRSHFVSRRPPSSCAISSRRRWTSSLCEPPAPPRRILSRCLPLARESLAAPLPL